MNSHESSPASVHHLVRSIEWNDAVTTAYSPLSLIEEGYIHFSTSEQVPETSQRYYKGVPDLLLVTVDVTRLTAELRWEDLAGHGEFPHLYGPLNLDAVTDVRPYRVGAPVSRDSPE